MVRKRIIATLMISLSFLAVPEAALAQLQNTVIETSTRGRNVSVAQRERPEYDSAGITTGGFVISPSLNIEGGYTDNAYLTETDRQSDAYVSINPEIDINSGWSRHHLAARASGEFLRYADNPLRNEDNFLFALEGRYDIGLTSAINGVGKFERRYESQYDVTSIAAGASPIPVDDYSASLIGSTTRGRFRFDLGAIGSRLDYHDYTTLGGGIVNQDSRDRTGAAVAGQINYSVNSGTVLFGQIGYENFSYDTSLGTIGANRDSNAVRVLGGVSFDLTKLIRGRLGAGYITRNYVAPQFRSTSGLTVEGELEYFPTELTTVTLKLHRVIEDASVNTQGGYFRTGGSLRIDHELLRNLLLNLRGSYDRAKYDGAGNDVDVFGVNGGARYLVSRHISLNGDLAYNNRDQRGTAPGTSFDEFRGSLSVGYHL